MLELKDGFVLYHGSYCEVKEPDLAKCAKRKDFGQGFYLTTSKEQAESFLRTSIVKAIATGNRILDSISLLRFQTTYLMHNICIRFPKLVK